MFCTRGDESKGFGYSSEGEQRYDSALHAHLLPSSSGPFVNNYYKSGMNRFHIPKLFACVD